MDKAALIVVGMVLFYLVIGFSLLAFPDAVSRARNALLYSIRAISKQQAHRPVSAKERTQSRVVGIIFVVGSLFILFQIPWQIGKLPENTPSVGEGMAKDASDTALHQLVTEIVSPFAPKHTGLIVVTIADNASDITGFGRVSLDSNEVPDSKTLFELGSLSKVFTGIALAESVNRAEVSLQATIASLLPQVPEISSSEAASITLEQLVTHTSGLPRMPARAFRFAQLWNAVVAGDSYHDYTENELLTLVAKKSLKSAPGQEFRYSNTGFALLGYILSQRYEREYQALIKTMIADPLGMTDTGVTLNSDQESRFAPGYRSYLRIGPYYFAQRAAHWNFPDCMAGAGGLRSTAHDMFEFLAANMGRTTSSITPALRKSHDILYTKDDTQIGMAWFHNPLPISGEVMIWHNGGTGGFSSFLGFSANGRFGVCVLSNSTRSVDPIGETLLEALVSAHPQPA